MIKLKNLIPENVWEPGKIIVGLIDTENNKIVSSDQIEAHYQLFEKYPYLRDKHSIAWRYVKSKNLLYFWLKKKDIDERFIEYIKKYLALKGFNVKKVEHIYDIIDKYKSDMAKYTSHGGAYFEKPKRPSKIKSYSFDPNHPVIAETLNESMTLYIKDTDYQRLDNLMDLSFHLQRIAYKVLESLPEDQINYYKKNRPMELLTVDGQSDIHDSVGVLNLYYSGYTNLTLKKILKEIIKELKKLNIQFGKLKIEDSKTYKYKVVRIPITKNQNKYTGAPDVNLSNRNAFHIFKNILQFEPDDDTNSSFSFTAQELKDRIESILKHDPDWISKHKISKHDSSIPDAEQDTNVDFENPHDDFIKNIFGGARVINMGLSEEDIKSRLYSILDVANWAIKHNKKDMYVA